MCERLDPPSPDDFVKIFGMEFPFTTSFEKEGRVDVSSPDSAEILAKAPNPGGKEQSGLHNLEVELGARYVKWLDEACRRKRCTRSDLLRMLVGLDMHRRSSSKLPPKRDDS
jgi:hypothetical protein